MRACSSWSEGFLAANCVRRIRACAAPHTAANPALPLPARALLLAPALHRELRLEVGDAAVLGGEAGDGAVGAGADVAAVFDQALLLAAAHLQDDLGDGDVGEDFEAGSEAFADRVDAGRRGDFDRLVVRAP